MKKLRTLFLGIVLGLTALPGQSLQQLSDQLWDDPEFVKDFLGSYGFLAGYEPTISEEEKEALRSLVDLIKVSPAAAIEQLEPQIKSSSSAAFDFILANLYFQEGNLAKAYKNLGLVQVQDGDFNAAIETISKAMELGEVDGRAYGLLGYGYLTQGRYYPAEAAYRQAILMQPEVKDWKVGLARALLETERYPDAIAMFDTLIKEEPDNADYWLLQSNAYIGRGSSMKAAQNIEVVRRLGGADLSTLTLLGDIYMNNEAPDLALDAYTAAIELADGGDSAPLLRAAEILTRTANYEQASTMIARLRDGLGDALSQSETMTLLTLEAKIARAQGDDEQAVETLKQIVAQDSLNGDALIELADYYAEQGDMAKAVTRYQQAEKIEAFERPALVAHAQALVREGDYQAALPLLRRALRIESEPNLEDYAQRVERAARNQS